MATDTAQRKSPISARNRARQATARRLAAEHTRLKDAEANLVAFFDATQAAEMVADELGTKIQSLRKDAATKTGAAEHAQALTLRALLGIGLRADPPTRPAMMSLQHPGWPTRFAIQAQYHFDR